MNSGKRIVLSTFGSFGDIHPYIAIGLELKRRGHHPVVATSEVYREKMEAVGLDFRPVRPDMPSHDDPESLTKLAEDLIHQQKGTEGVIRLFTQNPREVYDDLYAVAKDADLLLTHPLPLVGPIVARQLGLPWISSVLSPVSLFSAYDAPVPPQMPSLRHLFQLSPKLTRAIINIAMRRFEKPVEPIYQLRTEFGMERGEHPLFAGQHSPTLVLALFSRLLAKPQPDWPPNTLVTGFPFYDRRDYFGERDVDPALLEFLDEGPPPIVFTLGSSAFWVARDFYRDSVKAAAEVGQRALLLIGHERNRPPEKLPPGVAA
ncbi:MAG TPA: glycosyltransferase, partial [Pyrinomonadaceae bacterium]|nr:glycosyltransferase [Pyrinomonadaceae bacterium]